MITEVMMSKYSAITLIIISAIVLSPFLFNHNSIGLPLIILGATFYFVGKYTMGRVWSIEVEPKRELVNKGLFSHIRHPLYSGLIIASIGLIISTLSIYFTLLFSIIILPFLYKRARIEEEVLKETLPGYKEYMRKTKMFLPKIL
jgi:protein-S-isoprenylcysteine O-methyltransferase Ste14